MHVSLGLNFSPLRFMPYPIPHTSRSHLWSQCRLLALLSDIHHLHSRVLEKAGGHASREEDLLVSDLHDLNWIVLVRTSRSYCFMTARA